MGGCEVVWKVFARKKPSFSHFSSSSARKDARGITKEGEVVGDGGGGDGRAMLVATAMLGVASEGSKKELREWGDRQIRGNENEGDGAK